MNSFEVREGGPGLLACLLDIGTSAQVKDFLGGGKLSFPTMTGNPVEVLAILAGYLLGSVSFSHLLARSKGMDLRSMGSGNLGATNAARSLGRSFGATVYFLDAAKGALPVLAVILILDHPSGGWIPVLAGAGALLGHVWPIWHGFRGGKGVATLTGAMFVLQPLSGLAAAGVALLLAKLCGYMSVGSLAYGIVLFAGAWLGHEGIPVLGFSGLAALFLFFTHRSNLKRLLNGTEARMGDPI